MNTYNGIDDMYADFLRMSAPPRRIPGVALESNGSMISRIIEAFKQFIARVKAWFTERFSSKNAVTKETVEAVKETFTQNRAPVSDRRAMIIFREIVTQNDATLAATKSFLEHRFDEDVRGDIRTSFEKDPAGYFNACLAVYASQHMRRHLTTSMSKVIFDDEGFNAKNHLPTITEMNAIMGKLANLDTAFSKMLVDISQMSSKDSETVRARCDEFWDDITTKVEREALPNLFSQANNGGDRPDSKITYAFYDFIKVFGKYREMGDRMVNFLATYEKNLGVKKPEHLESLLSKAVELGEKDESFAKAIGEITLVFKDVMRMANICYMIAVDGVGFTKTYLIAREKNCQFLSQFYTQMSTRDDLEDRHYREIKILITDLQNEAKEYKDALGRIKLGG